MSTVEKCFTVILVLLMTALQGQTTEPKRSERYAKGVRDSVFSEQDYVVALKENMISLKKSFPTSTTMIYANFIPGEWLPGDDKGYLRGI
ncbi:MAG: hypothetical protein ACKOZZ_04700, partial [Bacteroidota bacterium]